MDEKEVVKKDYNPCNKCTHKGWDMPQCHYCNKANGYKYRMRLERVEEGD